MRNNRLTKDQEQLVVVAAVSIVAAILLTLALLSSAHAAEPTIALSHPICPSGFWIAQRIDKRTKTGAIKKAVWRAKCGSYRIIYAAH